MVLFLSIFLIIIIIEAIYKYIHSDQYKSDDPKDNFHF